MASPASLIYWCAGDRFGKRDGSATLGSDRPECVNDLTPPKPLNNAQTWGSLGR